MSARPTAVVTSFLIASVGASMGAPVAAQRAERTVVLPEQVVTATAFAGDADLHIAAPARVVAGRAVAERPEHALGDTLANELGVSASSFGAGASRPVIRGLGGPRVKVLQNGSGVADVSTLSEDHAVGLEMANVQQIEILRGPATLMYGSGAIGGLVNVVNQRIASERVDTPSGEISARHASAQRANAMAFSLDAGAGSLGLHVDGSWLNAGNYRIPGTAEKDDPASPRGRLPRSYTTQRSGGVGLSHIDDWGYIGLSIGSHQNEYGVPSHEGARIDMAQMRYDVEGEIKAPIEGIRSVKFKVGYTDYAHTEMDLDYHPEVEFTNRTMETRWEARHEEINGWRGVFGLHTELGRYAGLTDDPHHPATVPGTRSRSVAGFVVEEKDFGPVRINTGARLESVERMPTTGQKRSFDLASYSLGGLWQFASDYGVGVTYSYAQRAPSTEELYSSGAHHATETFDIGNANLRRETSRNVELSLQKTTGLVRWKANVYQNRFADFVYGYLTGNDVDHHGHLGGDLHERIFTQGDATLRGAEAEVSYNMRGQGFSTRGFVDTTRGKLKGGGNLPLQPPTRVGIELGYRQGGWHGGFSTVHALKQKRLADFETNPAASYTRVDLNAAYTQRISSGTLTWFAQVRNLLNEEIRLSTSLLKDVAPQPGRGITVGMRAQF